MKKKLKKVLLILLIIIIGLIIPSSLIINNLMILPRIYYIENFEVNVQNSGSLIEKSELFEYEKYCKYRTHNGEISNLWDSFPYYYIDREFIENYKVKIDNDKTKFHLLPYHSQNFIYSLNVSNESLIYLTYNNNTVIKAEFADHTDIFTAKWEQWVDNTPYWDGSWYLNFTQIPHALNMSSTIVLNNIFLVKMNFEYVHSSWFLGEDLRIEQYLIFDSNFQIILVYIPSSTYSIT